MVVGGPACPDLQGPGTYLVPQGVRDRHVVIGPGAAAIDKPQNLGTMGNNFFVRD